MDSSSARGLATSRESATFARRPITARILDRLIEFGFIDELGEDVWLRFADWHDYQPIDATSVERVRRSRQKRYGTSYRNERERGKVGPHRAPGGFMTRVSVTGAQARAQQPCGACTSAHHSQQPAAVDSLGLVVFVSFCAHALVAGVLAITDVGAEVELEAAELPSTEELSESPFHCRPQRKGRECTRAVPKGRQTRSFPGRGLPWTRRAHAQNADGTRRRRDRDDRHPARDLPPRRQSAR